MEKFCSVVTGLVLAWGHCPLVIAQDWEREALRFSKIKDLASELAANPFQASPSDAVPAWVRQLTDEQFAQIQFRQEHSLWAADKLPFTAMLFHPGPYHRDPLLLNEFTQSHQQKIRFSEAFFSYGPKVPEHSPLPADGGFAGFRIHYPLNRTDYQDELISVIGGCAWRALGQHQRYGVSSRALLVNPATPDKPEEFPVFREAWLCKPGQGDSQVQFFALLDGPSCAAAYSFRVQPGTDTKVDVRAVIFPRKEIKRLGIAPISSMYWFGENSRRRFDDVRPEVHDSDGLAIRMGSEERIWRPLANDCSGPGFSFFNMDECKGFGLLQRDRKAGSYDDREGAFEQRPSLWIEPLEGWGAGQVILMEFPAKDQKANNIHAMWEPSPPITPGRPLEISFRQHWTMKPDPADAHAYVVATRTGLAEQGTQQRVVMIDFEGETLAEQNSEEIQAKVEVLGEQDVVVEEVSLARLSTKRMRVRFHLKPADPQKTLADLRPAELRCHLTKDQQPFSETWAYRITP